MKTISPSSILGLALGAIALPAGAQEVLPFQPTPSASTAGLTMQDSVHQKRVTPSRLPAGAPNILIILIDDVGPGVASTYGGEINTPTLDRVAQAGISYNRFHSTAMCSPTRASLLTGRNHTRVGNGQICELANDAIGWLREQQAFSPDKPFFLGFDPRGGEALPAPPHGGMGRFHRARRLQCRPHHR